MRTPPGGRSARRTPRATAPARPGPGPGRRGGRPAGRCRPRKPTAPRGPRRSAPARDRGDLERLRRRRGSPPVRVRYVAADGRPPNASCPPRPGRRGWSGARTARAPSWSPSRWPVSPGLLPMPGANGVSGLISLIQMRISIGVPYFTQQNPRGPRPIRTEPMHAGRRSEDFWSSASAPGSRWSLPGAEHLPAPPRQGLGVTRPGGRPAQPPRPSSAPPSGRRQSGRRPGRRTGNGPQLRTPDEVRTEDHRRRDRSQSDRRTRPGIGQPKRPTGQATTPVTRPEHEPAAVRTVAT